MSVIINAKIVPGTCYQECSKMKTSIFFVRRPQKLVVLIVEGMDDT